MRERRGIFFSVAVSVILIVVLGLAPAPGQPTSPAAVDVTFPDTVGTLQLSGQLYRPDGPGACRDEQREDEQQSPGAHRAEYRAPCPEALSTGRE